MQCMALSQSLILWDAPHILFLRSTEDVKWMRVWLFDLYWPTDEQNQYNAATLAFSLLSVSEIASHPQKLIVASVAQ